jgi:hypothetical protein
MPDVEARRVLARNEAKKYKRGRFGKSIDNESRRLEDV